MHLLDTHIRLRARRLATAACAFVCLAATAALHAQVFDALDRTPTRPTDLGPRWAVLEVGARWELTGSVLRAMRGDGPPWQTIALHNQARFPAEQTRPVEVVADFALSENDVARYAGLVFHHTDDDNHYLFRFNLPGNVQIVRYARGEVTALVNENRRIFNADEFVRLRVHFDAPGVFAWSVETASRGSLAGKVTDLDPLRGGLAGLYTSAPRLEGRHAAFFRNFSFNPDVTRAATHRPSRLGPVPPEALR